MVFCKMRKLEVPRHCGHCKEYKLEDLKNKNLPKRDNFSLNFPKEPIDFKL